MILHHTNKSDYMGDTTHLQYMIFWHLTMQFQPMVGSDSASANSSCLKQFVSRGQHAGIVRQFRCKTRDSIYSSNDSTEPYWNYTGYNEQPYDNIKHTLNYDYIYHDYNVIRLTAGPNIGTLFLDVSLDR